MRSDAYTGVATSAYRRVAGLLIPAAAMEEQGATTQEIARNVQEAAAGTSEVSKNISGVTQASQESGAAASQVLSSSGEFSKQSELLKTEVEKFIAEVRAA